MLLKTNWILAPGKRYICSSQKHDPNGAQFIPALCHNQASRGGQKPFEAESLVRNLASN